MQRTLMMLVFISLPLLEIQYKYSIIVRYTVYELHDHCVILQLFV